MAYSSLLGIDRIPPVASGHDNASLGPSDSSDTGSDIAGIEEFGDADAMLPVDVALAADRPHIDAADDFFGSDGSSDSAGTGERRGAGGDSGIAEGADIAPDRIVAHPDASEDDESEWFDGEVDDELLAAVANGDAQGADATIDDPDEEGSATPESDAALRPRSRRRKVL